MLDQVIGIGDGTTTVFQLTKTYSSTTQSQVRNITRPQPGTVIIAVNGTLNTNWTVDDTTGLVTFGTAPAANAVITAGFLFYVPVRFDTDILPVTIEDYGVGGANSVKLIEVRPSDSN
jgi:uncharacterized protein (TIGR02217 family)